MLKAYFDDSGTHAQSKMVAIAGFIGDATVWDSFDANWEPILTAPDKSTRLSEFKMYDCVHGVEEFSPPLWGFADRLACAGRVADVLDATDIMAIGSITVREDIQPLLDNPWFSQKIRGTIYYLCFEHCIQMAVNWTKRYCAATGKQERIALVFDEQSEFSTIAEEIYKEYKKSPVWGEWLVSCSIASSKDFYPLQAADFLAYGTVDLKLREYLPSEKSRDFPVGPVFDRLMQTVARAGGMYDKESLNNLIGHMIETDEAMLAEQKLAIYSLRNKRQRSIP